jgi:hypothetical protein
MNWPVECRSSLILLLYIFPFTLEESTTFLQINISLKMRAGEISNEMDVEEFDIMLIQPLLSEKLLISSPIK